MVRGRVGFLLKVVRGPLFVREEPFFESMLVGIGMCVLHVVVRNWPIMDFSADGAPDLAGLLGKLQKLRAIERVSLERQLLWPVTIVLGVEDELTERAICILADSLESPVAFQIALDVEDGHALVRGLVHILDASPRHWLVEEALGPEGQVD